MSYARGEKPESLSEFRPETPEQGLLRAIFGEHPRDEPFPEQQEESQAGRAVVEAATQRLSEVFPSLGAEEISRARSRMLRHVSLTVTEQVSRVYAVAPVIDATAAQLALAQRCPYYGC